MWSFSRSRVLYAIIQCSDTVLTAVSRFQLLILIFRDSAEQRNVGPFPKGIWDLLRPIFLPQHLINHEGNHFFCFSEEWRLLSGGVFVVGFILQLRERQVVLLCSNHRDIKHLKSPVFYTCSSWQQFAPLEAGRAVKTHHTKMNNLWKHSMRAAVLSAEPWSLFKLFFLLTQRNRGLGLNAAR